MEDIQTSQLNKQFIVRQRLDNLLKWREEWVERSASLDQRIRSLDKSKDVDIQQGWQIGNLRRRLALQQVRIPLEIKPDLVKEIGYDVLRRHLVQQFKLLSLEERLPKSRSINAP